MEMTPIMMAKVIRCPAVLNQGQLFKEWNFVEKET
jgi:hypothetical protein